MKKSLPLSALMLNASDKAQRVETRNRARMENALIRALIALDRRPQPFPKEKHFSVSLSGNVNAVESLTRKVFSIGSLSYSKGGSVLLWSDCGKRFSAYSLNFRDMCRILSSVESKVNERAPTYKFVYEHTDTFGGDANYTWVKRGIVEAETIRAALKLAKRECGLSGVRGQTDSTADQLEFRPARIAQVLFVNPAE